jgi:acetylornithine/N-succinyldiaminopimelate aminotransferase
MTAGSHGSTFGGNPLAMAVGNAVLDILLAEGFLDNVNRVAALLRQRLEATVARYPKLLAEVRGMGLLLGVKCAVPSGEVLAKLREAGLLTVLAGDNVVRFVPPLIVTDSQVEDAVAILDKVCAGWSTQPS